MTLALFDLDHTLLAGDSHVLWCDFLARHGRLTAEQHARSDELQAAYHEGRSTPAAFCHFYVGLFAGGRVDEWAPWCERFVHEEIVPRLTPAAHARVDHHRRQGHTLVLTSATNRVLTAGSATALGIAHLIATEVEVVDGRYTGRPTGVLNMREGKIARLHAWLDAQGLPAASLREAWFYSDSFNDLPLLGSVGRPVAVDPDARLARHAADHGWPVISLR